MASTQKFTEAKLEEAIIELLESQGYPYVPGNDLVRDPSDVLIRSDLRDFLKKRYANQNITEGEIDSILKQLDSLNSADMYDSNKTICKWLADGFLLKREDRDQKDLYIQLIDYAGLPLGRGGQLEESDEIASAVKERLASYDGEDSKSDDNIYKIVN
jgi:type I restriction enzyme, R subunit